ncbi:MAG TPA: putative porin, partial [Chitinophagaceae bacterium]|nr:putative porin [Chitinophagaceae bacterium]
LDAPKSFNKETTAHFFGTVINPLLNLQLGADYYLVKNYLYFTNYYQPQQEDALFNVLRVNALKTFKIARYWRLHSEVYVQQKAGNAAVQIPLVFTRNRFAFEGNFFRNLFIATGVEARYHTPYKGDNYSPLLGQFFYQDSVTLNNLPDVAAYLNIRIKSFKAFVRAENLNTLWYNGGTLNFTHNNLAAPDYPYPGLNIRLSIYWSFVN